MKRALLLVLVGCAPAPQPTEPPANPTVQVTAPPPAEPAAPEPPPAPTSPAEDEIIGSLALTKGAQPVIAGRMLPSDAMAERFGDDWRKLVDRRFRVRGETHDHTCDPRAQCLTGGVIPLMRNIRSIDQCKSCDGTGDVDCPISEEERDACLAQCNAESSRCDAGAKGDRGRLKRCGSKRVGCRSACKRFGEPNPWC